ncbi:DUF1846 domain-containing protein [Patescibacteria group bacterium]|nr:DUF1846 domain-containing protein [Patescibacteria group bacterium]MBU1758038.1 DUF1846 domain-containing protein [Patescibacteria group bacterium]
MYLEIGGKFLYDQHAARVLPGFDPESKKVIFASLKDQTEILFCVSADDILENRQLSNQEVSYKEYVYRMLRAIEKQTGITPHIVINKIDVVDRFDLILDFEKEFQRKNYRVWERYKIMGYPHNTKSILSEDGFGNDDHIPLTKNLVLVTGAASSSGKMSTCLGQIYNDHEIGIKSGYAKYETFPIWNIPLNHPINLAYEAATADIGDYNMLDPFHKAAYGKDSVNYNRDIEAFEIVMNITKNVVAKTNFMNTYKSPTDMGISSAGFAITDDEACSIASLHEIQRRKGRYQQMIDRGEGKESRTKKCDELEEKCREYINSKKYTLDHQKDL